MSKPLDARLRVVARKSPGSTPENLLEDYVDHLTAPLVGIVPFPERKAFRDEASLHIEGLIQIFISEGQDVEAATKSALLEFGEPWKIGQAFLQEWLQGTPTQRPAILIRRASLTAFAWFGPASFLSLLLIEHSSLMPTNGSEVLVLIGIAILSPAVSGCITGFMAPGQTDKGVRNAMVALVCHSFVTGLLILPHYAGLLFSMWQLLFWLPVGRITASISARSHRHFWRQRFWQLTRVEDRQQVRRLTE